MKNKGYLLFSVFVILLTVGRIAAQEGLIQPPPKPTPIKPTIGSKLQTTETPRERREQAYAKLLEGQRYIWGLSNARTQAGITAGTRLAKESIQKAVELDPTLSEGYTALAELSFKSPPNDLDEAIRLAIIAVKINPDNFGGHLILARLYTIKSRLNRGNLDDEKTRLAIQEWEEIGRLDPRNAEAFAFLSEFYNQTKQYPKRNDALKKWLASATPLDTRFYQGIMRQEDLAPETALIKLGAALFDDGEIKEAVEILSRAVVDDPNSDEAIERLSRAIEAADSKTAAAAVESLQQAAFSNPENRALPVLLAQIQARTGNFNDSVKLLGKTISKLAATDKIAASIMQISLGDIFFEADRFDEAAAAYKSAPGIRGIENKVLITDDDGDFAVNVYEKLIRTYKIANRPNDVKRVVEEARLLFGKDDLFADKQLILFFKETGQRNEALQAIRSLRVQNPQDYELLKMEALALTDLGKVEDGVGLVRALIGKKGADGNTPNPLSEFDDYINYLYISSLYINANRGNEAIEAANQAILAAKGDDRKQIARLTLASAQQSSGSFASAEMTLRDVLKQTPGFPQALNNLGYYLLERNEKLEEALELIQQAVEVDPANPSYLDSLGWAYFKLGKLDEAEKYLKTAARISTGSATILEHLGDVYQKQGKSDLAKSAWQKALKITTDQNDIKRLKTKMR